jgi:hypothetical protein
LQVISQIVLLSITLINQLNKCYNMAKDSSNLWWLCIPRSITTKTIELEGILRLAKSIWLPLPETLEKLIIRLTIQTIFISLKILRTKIFLTKCQMLEVISYNKLRTFLIENLKDMKILKLDLMEAKFKMFTTIDYW